MDYAFPIIVVVAIIVGGILFLLHENSPKMKAKRERERREKEEADKAMIEAVVTVVGAAAVGYGLYQLGKALFKDSPTSAVAETPAALPAPEPPPPVEISPEELARRKANSELHQRLTADLDDSFDWCFSNGQEFYTLYDGDFTFQHYNRHTAAQFGWSTMTLEGKRVQIDHYNNNAELIGWTNDEGERYTMKTDRVSGDLVWPLYRQYIRPYQLYQRDRQ